MTHSALSVALDINIATHKVVWGSEILAALVFVAAVVFWPGKGRLGRHWGSVLTVLARLGTILVVMVTTFVALGLYLNVKFSLASTVGDIVQEFETQSGTTPQPGVPVVAGNLTHYTVKGLVSKHTNDVDVWTPPGYNAHRAKAYPVIMALHGFPGNPEWLVSHVSLLAAVQQTATEHKIAWPVIVLPHWGNWSKTATWTSTDSECVNGTAQWQEETWLGVDVPVWLKAHFHVLSGHENWATYGFSAGAFCSRMLTMLHPGQFGADIDLSGYSYPDFARSYVPFTPSSPQGQRYDLVAKAQLDPPHVALYLMVDPRDTSAAEGSSYPSTLALKNAAHAPMKVTWVETHGGHTVASWNPQTKLGLEWLGRTLKGFKA